MNFVSPSQLITVIARQAFRVRGGLNSVVVAEADSLSPMIDRSGSLIICLSPSAAPARSAVLAGADQMKVCSPPSAPGSEDGLLYNPHRKR